MQFEYKGHTYNFPDKLRNITLGQRIAYHEQYGRLLDERREAILAMPDDGEREMETAIWHMDAAIAMTAHYCGLDAEQLKEEAAIGDITAMYNACVAVMQDEETALAADRGPYSWNGTTWYLAPPEVDHVNGMTFNEFLHAKEITRQMAALGKSRWEVLPHLCAIYLRQDGEAFSEGLLNDKDGEGKTRVEIMDGLPLDIALAVGFFLTGTMSIWQSGFRSSVQAASRESILQDTSTSGDGSRS